MVSAEIELPNCFAVRPKLQGGVLWLTLDRPDVRNAMSLAMVEEIEALFAAVEHRRSVRVVVLRGRGGTFCSGGDIKEMAVARAASVQEGEPDPLALTNRRYGTMITRVDRAPQAVVAVAEGAVMGGGFGLCCVADVVLAREGAVFALPEASLGIPPAQIATFLVRRLGPYRTRRLVVTGVKLSAPEAHELGLVDEVFSDEEALDNGLAGLLAQIRRGAPGALAVTKAILSRVGHEDHEALLDRCADQFATAARGEEGREGALAFLQKRKPSWAE